MTAGLQPDTSTPEVLDVLHAITSGVGLLSHLVSLRFLQGVLELVKKVLKPSQQRIRPRQRN
eukprot:6428540-Amphidinium_carterae.1